MPRQETRVRLMDGYELIPAPRVAEIMGITTKHIRFLERQGDFPPRVVIGPRTICYKRSDLEAWIDARSTRLCKGAAQ